MAMTTNQATVAIPCYNGAAYIGRTIESVLHQSQPATEVLVIDDGSTDNSRQIIAQYPVRLVAHEQNKGLATARNTAVSATTTNILIFVDVDAFADYHLVETLLSGYTGSQIAGVGGQGIESNINSLADRWRRTHASQGHGDKPKAVDYLYGLCMSYHTAVLQQIGGFDPIYRTNAEDVDMGLRLRAAGYQLRYLPEAKVYHQRTDDQASLEHAMFNWYRAGYTARRRSQAAPWRLFLGTATRLLRDPAHDLWHERDLAMAYLSWRMGWIKLKAIWSAAQIQS